ncbi:MAG: hypothetical protein L0Y66_21120 [Myxococcaceae bacterium]|nr:hypothetical protein [Myxococcaceae bacterium]MCI0671061.1 hypothetical protein [Myxococcaceae bacterium]
MGEWTHAAGDGLLAAVSLTLAWRMRRNAAACGAWAGLGAAAAVGTLRYAGLELLAPAHGFLSDVAGWASLPLLALQGRLRWGSVLAALGAAAVLAVSPVPSLVQISVGALAVLALVVAFARAGRWMGVVGALGFPVAALAIGTRGELAGFHRMDLYHLTLAVSVGLMGLALTQAAPTGDAETPSGAGAPGVDVPPTA